MMKLYLKNILKSFSIVMVSLLFVGCDVNEPSSKSESSPNLETSPVKPKVQLSFYEEFKNKPSHLKLLMQQKTLLETILKQKDTEAMPLAITLFNSLLMHQTFSEGIETYYPEGLHVFIPSLSKFPFGTWAYQIHKKLAIEYGAPDFIHELFTSSVPVEPANNSPKAPSTTKPLTTDQRATLWSWFIKAALLGEETTLNFINQPLESSIEIEAHFTDLQTTNLGLPETFENLKTLLRLQKQLLNKDYTLLNPTNKFGVDDFNSITKPLVFLFYLGFGEKNKSFPYSTVHPKILTKLWNTYNIERIYKVYMEQIRGALTAKDTVVMDEFRLYQRSVGKRNHIACEPHLGYQCTKEAIAEKMKP